MKKGLALFLTLGMAFAMTACGSSVDEPADDATTVIEEDADISEESDTEGFVEESEGDLSENVIEEGRTGTGEELLSTEFFDLTVPENIQYEVYYYSVDPDTNSGTIDIDMGEYSTLEMRLEATTTRMATSMDEAVEECIRTKNLDTYENGSYEELDPVSINGTEYRAVKITTEYSETTNLVTYYQNAETGMDMYIEIELSSVDIESEYVQSALNSIIYK